MVIYLPDNLLEHAGVTEREAKIELACRLFDVGRLQLPAAARLAGLGRVEFEDELASRGIAAYRPTVPELERDMETLAELRAAGKLGGRE